MQQQPYPPEMFTDPGRMVQFCPMCDAEYNPSSAYVLGEHQQGSMLHVECRNCRHAIAAVLTQTAMGVNSFGFITDASPDDLLRSMGAESISADDVIDMHVQLGNSTHFAKELTKTK